MRPALLALGLLAPASAGAFELQFPVSCVLGQNCHIQHLPDRDPGPDPRDFACGTLTYDGHDGTDIALSSLSAMGAGVDVLAAADGVVRGVRDGMPDIIVSDPAAPPLDGRDCGNGVAITHDGGWETQYCHMKLDSVAVRAGDRVKAGDRLGQIGLSGNTEFPHLHLTLRQDGQWVDPWSPAPDAACGPADYDLWAGKVQADPGGIITAGFADSVPEYVAVKAGDIPLPDETAPGLVFWAYLFGTRAGDQLQLDLTGPEGAVAQDTITLERTQAQSFRAIGRKLRSDRWPAGIYTGAAELRRDGALIDRFEARLSLP
ncbi:MAG: M23 family metallopeptidase [Gemmobacter sp.]